MATFRARSPKQQAFKKNFTALIAEIKAARPEGRDLEVWCLDEARVGQTGRTCWRWFEKGIRPRGRRDLRHGAVYLCGAVCPHRDHGVALVLPEVNTAAMRRCSTRSPLAGMPPENNFLSRPTSPRSSCRRTPELNAIERVWLYLRERFLSQRLWPTYDDILAACCAAWTRLRGDQAAPLTLLLRLAHVGHT